MTDQACKTNQVLWYVLLLFGVGIGAAAAIFVLMNGHGHAYNVTRQIPWGILISTYVFFVVSSTGLCLVSSLGHVFGIKQFELIGKRAIILAIITLLAGFGTIGMEITHPFRMGLYVLLSPNFQSPIWWMGTLYGFYLVLLCGELYALMRGNHKMAFTFGLIGFIAAVSAHSNLGAVFGLLEARVYWHGAFLPIYFILSALVSGGAILSMIIYFTNRSKGFSDEVLRFAELLGKVQALFIGILIFFIIWKTIPGIYGAPPEKYEATMALIAGPLSFFFWFFEVLIGMLIPFAILMTKKMRTPFGVMMAGLLSTIGIFFMRYDLVIAGQLVPMRRGSGEVVNGLLSYTPSIAEMSIVVGGISFVLFAYMLVERFLPLDHTDH